MGSQTFEEDVANQCEIGQEVGIARAGTILAHERIAPPMVAILNPAPMATDQVQPSLRWIMFRRQTGQIVARFTGGDAGLFDGSLTPQNHQASGGGKIGAQRLEGEGVQLPDGDASVSWIGLGEKGVVFKAFNPCACLSRLGWLPLIWKR